MRLRTIITALLALAAAGGSAAFASGTAAPAGADVAAAGIQQVPVGEIAPGQAEYYATAESLVNGLPVTPPRLKVVFDQPLHIMTRQVSQAEYAECVKADACRPLHRLQRNDLSPDLPVVGVNWLDATSYARWYSEQTGEHYRLPTYAEWVHAAGEAFTEDQRIDIYDPNNPAQRWLADYALETQR